MAAPPGPCRCPALRRGRQRPRQHVADADAPRPQWGFNQERKIIKDILVAWLSQEIMFAFLIFIHLLDQMITHSRETSGTIMFQKDAAGINW